MLKKTVKGSGTVLSMNIFATLISLVVTLTLVALLTQSDYGLLLLTLAAYNMATTFMSFEIGTLVASEIARHKGAGRRGELKRIVKDYSIFQIGSGIVLGVFVFFFADFVAMAYSDKIVSLVQLSSVMLIISGFKRSFQNVLYGHSKFFLQSSVPVVEAISKLVYIYILLVEGGMGVYGALLAYVLATATSTLILLPFYLKLVLSLKNVEIAERMLLWKVFKKHGKYVVLSSIFKNFKNNLPVWIVEFFGGLETVAIYGLAKRIQKPSKLIFTSIETFLLPTMSEEIGKNVERFNLLFHRATKYAFWLSMVLVVPAILLSPLAIDIIAPDSYAESVPVLQILFLGLLITGLANAQRGTLFALKSQKYLFYSNLIALVLILVLGTLLTYYYGAIGMAMAVVIRGVLTMIIKFRLISKKSKALKFSLGSLFIFDDYDRKVISRIFKKARSVF